MKILNLGFTSLGLPIHAYHFLPSANTQTENLVRVLILGGVHGEEVEGVVAARCLLEHFRTNYSLNLNLKLVPELNPEGVLLKLRGNSNKVDLNRNLPTKDWSPIAATERYNPGPAPMSEPENKVLVHLIDTFNPDVVFSLHSWKPMLNVNGDLPEAQIIAEKTGYIIDPDIGYPTPGSLGTYAGIERGIPTLTYELERGIAFKPIVDIHVPAIIAGLKQSEKRTRKHS